MANVIATNFGEFSTSASDFFESVVLTGTGNFNTSDYASFWPNGAGQAFRNTNNAGTGYRLKTVPAQTEYFAHVRQRLDAGGAQRGILAFFESGTLHISVWQNAAGNIIVLNGASATIATGATVFPTTVGRILSVQIRVVIHDTTGVVQVRINGSTTNEIDFSGDTRNGGTGVINQIGPVIGGANDVQTTWTDFVVNDTTGSFETSWPGAVRVVLGALTITGGSGVQFTPLSSTNVSNIDDAVPGAHDSDSTYNEDSTAGHKDFFQLASSVFTGMSPAAIRFVRTKYWARAADGGTHTFRSNAKAGGTTVNGTTATLGSTYAMNEDVFYQDPSTSAAWASFAAITGAEFGYELVS